MDLTLYRVEFTTGQKGRGYLLTRADEHKFLDDDGAVLDLTSETEYIVYPQALATITTENLEYQLPQIIVNCRVNELAKTMADEMAVEWEAKADEYVNTYKGTADIKTDPHYLAMLKLTYILRRLEPANY